MADQQLLQDVADRAAKKAVEELVPIIVRQTFITMGLDPDDPMEAQKDAVFIRSTRTRCEQVNGKGLMLLVGIVGAGALALMWDGFKHLFKP
jgi:hypothetical protein